MHRAVRALVVFWGLSFGADSVNFDTFRPGLAPPEWTSVLTRGETPVTWQVRADPTAPSRPNVLERISGPTGEFEFPVAVFDRVVCRDGDLSVKIKIHPGCRAESPGGI